jgi:RND family efflux transporter MFP subunit
VIFRPGRRASVALIPLAALVALAACRNKSAEEVDSETAVTVKATAAALGTIRGVVHATAIVNPAPGAELIVIAPEAARIAAVPHAAGDRVRLGDVLVRFEIPSATAEVQRQQAEVTRAQATLDNARRAQTRAGELFDRGVAARKEVEDTNRGVADAEAALSQARASLAAARAVAGRAIVRATFDGIVATRLHNPGDLVEATASDPVLRVLDPRRLEVVASIPLTDARRIEVGAPARMTANAVNAPEVGLKVVSHPAAIEAGSATVPVRLAFVGPATFPAGTPVQVDIDAERHTNVVLVPAVAIVREGEETAVFVVSGAEARRRPVRIGLSDSTHVEILSGVKAGEHVIVDGQAGLPDGAAITVSHEQDSSATPAAAPASPTDEAK